MYERALIFHSWMRWAVLLLAVAAISRALVGYAGQRPWNAWDARAGLLFTVALDIEVFLGLILYLFLTPFAHILLDDFSTAIRVGVLRFWTVEHTITMVIALGLTHVGRARIQRTVDSRGRHRSAMVFITLALVAIVAAVPWPGTVDSRPLFRFSGGGGTTANLLTRDGVTVARAQAEIQTSSSQPRSQSR